MKLRGIARKKGLSISEYGLARLDGSGTLQPESEEELYRTLGLAPVPPELREDSGELELAEKASLPELVSLRDIRGFVHCHSTWSDGKATVDILEDGALDWPDAILEKLDVVICSVHQRFKLDEPRQTERIRRALSHPLCGIWGHPTGRYLGDRDPMAARWEELIEVAAERGVTIECNGTPHRLDFSADLLRLDGKVTSGERPRSRRFPLHAPPLTTG